MQFRVGFPFLQIPFGILIMQQKTYFLGKNHYLALAAFLLCFVVGCGSNVKVTGKVLFEDGSPLATGTVIFDDGKMQAKGDLGSDGSYSLYTLNPNDGIPPGDYKVYLIGTLSGGSIGGKGNVVSLPKELVDQKFNRPETSGLVCQVKGKTTFDFKVTPPSKK